MLPDLPLERYTAIGNSSLEGATLALQSVDTVGRIEALRERVTYLELNVNQAFMNRFSAARFLPHTDRSRFPRVPIIHASKSEITLGAAAHRSRRSFPARADGNSSITRKMDGA
jgi:uncharacterized 2Fe-2S/4Fe-4S cluster protein (DUF4445 family)